MDGAGRSMRSFVLMGIIRGRKCDVIWSTDVAMKQEILKTSTILNSDAVGTKHQRQGNRSSEVVVKRGSTVDLNHSY